MQDSARTDLKPPLARFDQLAADYASHAAVQHEIGQRLLGRLDGLNFEPATVLDAGCGPGHFALDLADRFPQSQVLALDGSRRMLDQVSARRRGWRFWQRPRIKSIQGDIRRLPLAESSVDLLFSSLVLPWCEDLAVLLNRFRRVLRPGGLLLLSAFGPDTLRALRGQVGDAGFGNVIDVQRLGDALVRAGFVEPVLDTDWITSMHSDADSLWRQLCGSGIVPTDPSAPGQWQQASEQSRDPGGQVRAEWETVYASAWGPEEGAPIRTIHGEEASVSVASIGRRKR